jgi:hypothetical protein
MEPRGRVGIRLVKEVVNAAGDLQVLEQVLAKEREV